MDLPVVNHPDYVAKINDDNKFPIQKFGALAKYLLKTGIVKKFHIPKECSTETMKTSHSLEYINHIRNKTLDIKLQKKIGKGRKLMKVEYFIEQVLRNTARQA